VKSSPPPSRDGGFTLLELVIAIGLMALLIGMVFSTARASLSLGTKVVETQNEEMLQQAFIQLLSNRFSSLPGNTRFDLKLEESGRLYLTDLTLQNVPITFAWGGEARVAKAIQLSTVMRRSGFLDIVLRYYENEILENSESADGGTMQALDNEPMAEIVLLTDVAFFEWAVIDGRAMDEWLYEWDFEGRLPLQLELKMAIGADGEEIRHVFWIPPKQNPEVMMRQMMQQAAGGQQPGVPGGGEGGGRPDGGGRPGGRPGAGEGGGRPGGAPGGPTIEIPSGPAPPR
jgi:type II secretory pathway pseudopilin PulG